MTDKEFNEKINSSHNRSMRNKIIMYILFIVIAVHLVLTVSILISTI